MEAALDCGEDVNSKDHEGRTAAFLAARQGHLAVVEALLARSADFKGLLAELFNLIN